MRQYKSGDFIFAKVKGWSAWPARVLRRDGKKYSVYFYGTGDTAKVSPTMIFDYAENKKKLSKSLRYRGFNDGMKQIEYDFYNNVPLEVAMRPREVAMGAPFESELEGPTEAFKPDNCDAVPPSRAEISLIDKVKSIIGCE